MKIKFNTDGKLTLNKPLTLRLLRRTVRYIFEEDSEFYLQLYLDDCLSQTTYKCWDIIKLIFQKELMLVKRVHQKNVIFVTTGILKIMVLITNHTFAMAVTI